MRQLAREHCWWPKISIDVELKISSCEGCQINAPDPPKLPVVPWPEAVRPWQRIHLDYAPRFHGFALLVLVDSQSKWVEVGLTKPNQTSSERTIAMLNTWFSRYGYPESIHCDNGTNFASGVFRDFCARIGAKLTFSPPYNPSTNGLAERSVQTVKRGLEKILSARRASDNLTKAVEEFLFSYRFLPLTSGVSPAELFLGRHIRSGIDLLKPVPSSSPQPHTNESPKLHVGSPVWYRNYQAGSRWKPGHLTRVLGRRHTLVSDDHSGTEVRRHFNQVRKRVPGEEKG